MGISSLAVVKWHWSSNLNKLLSSYTGWRESGPILQLLIRSMARISPHCTGKNQLGLYEEIFYVFQLSLIVKVLPPVLKSKNCL